MILTAILVAAFALPPAPQPGQWRLWSPRPEISPAGRQLAGGSLLLSANGNASVFGGWQNLYTGVQPGQWYRLQVTCRASGLSLETLQRPVRLDWQSAEGKRTGQPDYAWRTTPSPQGAVLTLDAPAPPKAATVLVQLFLQNAPKGEITWSSISLTPIPAPAPRPVKIAAIRLRPRGPDPVARFLDLATQSVESGTDVIVLPEGITVVGSGRSYADAAESIPGSTTERLAPLAREKKAWIVAGIYEREGASVYNTAVLLDRSGKVAGKYRKIYIPREELEGGITPGSDYPVFQTDFGTVGLLICWDIQYADPARALARKGAELLLLPIWGGNETLAQARAIENQVYLASSGYDFPSLLLDPWGKTLVRTEKDGSVATHTIDLNQRHPDPWLGDMRGRFHHELRLDVPIR